MQSETILMDVAGLRLSERVLRIGRGLGRGAQKPHQSFASGLACSLLEEVGRGFHHSNFFGDRYRDPLVQRHAIFFRQSLGSLLDGERKLQWIRGFAHYLSLTFFNSSAGRNTGILNRSAPNSTVEVQSLKGRLILELSESLKRCPDTKPHFFLPSILPPPETGLSSVSTSGGDATSAACCWNGFACS